jgi:gliding motility-associated-like protein
MKKLLKYSILFQMLIVFITANSQVSMPDTICVGTNRLYHVNNATTQSTYTWTIDNIIQTSTSNSISIIWKITGTHLITVVEHSVSGCDGDMRSGYVYVKSPPIANAGPDVVVCYGVNQQLNGSGGSVYHWSPSNNLSNSNIANPTINSQTPGTFIYTLDVSDINACGASKKDTVVITVLPQAKIFAGNDTSVVMNQSFQLNAIDLTKSGFINFSWSPSFGLSNSSIKNPIAILSSDARYIVTAKTAAGCEAKDDISIKVFAQADFYVPTAFTPNGDGLNDILKLIPIGIKELKYFNIYNRWGQLVFSTTDPSKGWDGTIAGQQQGTFVFVWVAEAIDYKGNVIRKKGTVTLIR